MTTVYDIDGLSLILITFRSMNTGYDGAIGAAAITDHYHRLESLSVVIEKKVEGLHSRTCVDRTDVDSYETEVKNYVATRGLYTSCRVLALYRLWTRWANNRLYRSPE